MNNQDKTDFNGQKASSMNSRMTSAFPPPQAGCYPGHWVGRFIWDRGESLPYHYYLMCRKVVEIHGRQQAARLHITAALKYMLWINGSYVGYGPARSYPEWKSYDTHDISELLQDGKNVIAVLCWFTGAPNNYSSDERAGMWAQMEYLDDQGRLHMIGSDETWHVRPAQGFRRDVGSLGGGQPATEVYEAGLDPATWTNLDFDDSTWENAVCLESGKYECNSAMVASWTYLEPRMTPLMRERKVRPAKLGFVGEADASFPIKDINVAERIGQQEQFPLQHARAENAQSLIGMDGRPAIFQNNQPSGQPEPPLTNVLAGQPCYVFGAVGRDESLPTGNLFACVPDKMVFASKTLDKQKSCLNLCGEIDLAPFIGGTGVGKTAYVYVPFMVDEDGTWTFGAGADWWMECYIDGQKIMDTLADGNKVFPPSFLYYRKSISLAKGAHLLVARVISGLASSVFACGIFSADRSGSVVYAPFITIDFGRAYNAFPCIEFEAPCGAVIEIACGGRMLPDGRVTWDADVSYAARYVSGGGRQCWRLFEPVPVRFLQIVFRHVDQPVRVFSVNLISWEYPAERRGAFSCSDDVLTKLWKAGVDTAYLHMDDTVIFDVIRERETYLFVGGEVEQGHLAIAAGYGDLPFAQWHIKQTLREQLPSGLFPITSGSYAPTNAGFPRLDKTRTPGKVCNCLVMSNYMAFIPEAIRNRYWHFGDDGMLKEWYPALVRLTDWFLRKSDDTGLLYNLPGQVWFDWVADQELGGANFECNAIYYKALVSLGEMAEWLHLPKEAEQWRLRATKVRDSLRAMHWDEKRGLFSDSVINGRQSPFFTELANGMALLYDIADESQKVKVTRALTQPENGCTPVTTLYFYYLMEGLIKAGAGDYALRRLSASNKVMMEYSDPPTFWEIWPEMKTTHKCKDTQLHFGGAGVVWTLSTQVLGVQSAAPGFAACRIEPKCGHMEWAKGVVPSVRGDIQVEWRKGKNTFALTVNLPDDLPTEIRLPYKPRKSSVVSHNSKSYMCQSIRAIDGIECLNDGIVVRVGGGMHKIEVTNKQE